jgi:hypothetical protein
MHPKDSELIPKGTKIIWTRPSHRIKPKVVRAIVREHDFRFNGQDFQNYRVEIIGGVPGELFVAYHSDLVIEKS